jgi:hypothetical protein
LAQIESYIHEFGIEWPNGYGAETTFAGFNIRMMAGFKFVIGRDGKVAWNSDSRGSLTSAIENALVR